MANFSILYPLKTQENQRFSGGTKWKHWPEMDKTGFLENHRSFLYRNYMQRRDFSRTLVTFKMQLFVTLVDDIQPLTNFTKNAILDVAGLLDSPLLVEHVHFVDIIFTYTVNLPIKALINASLS